MAGQPGLDSPAPIGPFLNGKLPSKSPGLGEWQLVNAFPDLTFVDPVQMLPVPGTNQLAVAEKTGRLVVFQNTPNVDAKNTLIDFTAHVESSHDSGFLGFAFHPEYGQAGSPNHAYLYCYYRYQPEPASPDLAYDRLSRFTWLPGSASIDPSSELVLINQYDRHNWHNGGGMFFGEDGFLYLAIGDEGGVNDPYGASQRMDRGLFGGVFRIDVDQDPTRSHPIRRQPLDEEAPPNGWPASFTQAYSIPNDNPWQAPDGSVLEEFYALGVRSPHRLTYDTPTGEIWLGDVGQDTEEEISLIVKGGNYQWPYREGGAAGPKPMPEPLLGADQPPLWSYGRDLGSCVIGGYVYRGLAHSALQGMYLVGDHRSGTIWALKRSDEGLEVTAIASMPELGPGPKNGLGSFGIDAAGEVYALGLAGTNLDGGRIFKLEPVGAAVSPPPPALLSQTGAFLDLQTLEPASGIVPYDVIAPLWSDGAKKRRWIAVPNDGTHDSSQERIGFSEEGSWTFPDGTVLIKHFELPIGHSNTRPVETRFLVHGESGEYYGLTYRWREDGTDADLLTEGLEEAVSLGNGQTQTWYYPGRQACFSCHTAEAGRVLGFRTRQLNRDLFYPSTGRTANQLTTLSHLGIIPPVTDDQLGHFLTSAALGDESASRQRRARSYLDSNCSHCHQPGATQALFDLRLSTPPAEQGILAQPAQDDLGIPGAQIVYPGSSSNSVLYQRVNSVDGCCAMPLLAKNEIDTQAVALLKTWIDQMDLSVATPSGDMDVIAPEVSLTINTTTVSGPFYVNVDFTEFVSGLTLSDFQVTNGTLDFFAGGGDAFAIRVTPHLAGLVRLHLPSDRVIDHALSTNPPSAPLSIEVAPAAPSGSARTDWDAWQASVLGAGGSPGANLDEDFHDDLYEFALGLNPASGIAEEFGWGTGFSIRESSPGMIEASYSRPAGISADVTFHLEVSSDLEWWSDMTTTAPMIEAHDGWETIRIPNLANGSAVSPELGFVRLRVQSTSLNARSYSPVWAWHQLNLGPGYETVGPSLLRAPLLVASVQSQDGSTIALGAEPSLVSSLENQQAYLEVLSGEHEGHRFEVAVVASAPRSLTILLDHAWNTRALPNLIGARVAIRPHLTLNQGFPPSHFAGSTDPAASDQILRFDGEGYQSWFLLKHEGQCHWAATDEVHLEDTGERSLPPGEGFFVQTHAATNLVQVGQLRTHAFVRTRRPGYQLFAGGWPHLAQSPLACQLHEANGFRAHKIVDQAAQLQVWRGDLTEDELGYESYFYIDHPAGAYWTSLADSQLLDFSNQAILAPSRAFFLSAQTPGWWREPSP